MRVLQEGGITQGADSLGYIADADRFVTDIAALNKMERDASVHKKAQQCYIKRLDRAEKEERRWGEIELAYEIEKKRMDQQRENFAYARSNKTSMPYDPITLRYDNGADGDRLRFSDESLRYRGALRAEHLQRRGASTPWDPITGQARQTVHVPEPPRPPL